jgi:hypothetical protein
MDTDCDRLMREVAMGANPKSGTKDVGDPRPDDKAIYWYSRVRDVREDFGRRIEQMSANSDPTIADQLLLAYYQSVLRLLESLPPETSLNSGYRMSELYSGRWKDVLKINQIHDYLIPGGGGSASQIGNMYLGPISRARRSPKKGRPVTQRSAALRALQLQIDTGQTWTAITKQVCGCGKKRHDRICKEKIRQSVNGLKRFLRDLGIPLPPKASH